MEQPDFDDGETLSAEDLAKRSLQAQGGFAPRAEETASTSCPDLGRAGDLAAPTACDEKPKEESSSTEEAEEDTDHDDVIRVAEDP